MLALALAFACGQPTVPLEQAEPIPEEAAPAEVAEPVAPAAQDDRHPALLDASLLPAGPAPDVYTVLFETTEGEFEVRVHRDWAPLGADRFHGLVTAGYYDGISFFRNIEGFMVQFGIHGDPAVNMAWYKARIADDPVKQSNTRGKLSFATAGANTRTTQVFINHGANDMLDGMGFAPFGEVISGEAVVDALYQGYGECAPKGRGPRQDLLMSRGDEYLKPTFPELDYVVEATIK